MKRSFLLLLALALAAPLPGGAQGRGPLDQVEALMDQGRIEAAREALLAWWDTSISAASRSDRQRGLWLRGSLTVDPAMAEADFQRLVLEYPGGPWTDQALYRLALWAEARGDAESAAAQLGRLVRDYPTSPLRALAEARLASDALSAPPLFSSPPPRGEAPAEGEAAARAPVGARQQPRAREGGGGEGRPSGAARDLPFAAQVGAFRSSERALAIAEDLREAGYQARIVRVPGSDLVRVRVGRFGDRDQAVALMRELRGRGFEATLATDAGSEEEIA